MYVQYKINFDSYSMHMSNMLTLEFLPCEAAKGNSVHSASSHMGHASLVAGKGCNQPLKFSAWLAVITAARRSEGEALIDI